MPLPPGPRRPAVLQTLQLTYWPLAFFDECLRRHGDPFTLRMLGFGDFVMLTGPELIKQVFTADPEVLHAGKANAILEPIVGARSVLLLDGKEHLRQRRLLLPPLHGERMQAYARLMAEITRAALDRMPLGEPFSLHPYMQSITLDVILRAVFGLAEGAEMRRLTRLLVAFVKPPPAFVTLLPVRYADFPLSPYRAFLRRRDAVDRELRTILRARMAAAAAGDDASGRTDILSLLLAARDEEGRPMSEDELRDELLTMLLAGHETTATSLSWAFALLLGAPEVAARLDAELDGAAAESDSDPAALTRIEWLDAVIKETLRLRPILPDVVRLTQAPYSIAGYDVPAGTHLTPCIHLAHRRPESWPEPDRFRPERFLGAKIDPYAFFPFGGGIRRCLGMAFALYEMKIVLGTILRGARLRLESTRPPAVARRGITLGPAGGTRVVLTERRPPHRHRPTRPDGQSISSIRLE